MKKLSEYSSATTATDIASVGSGYWAMNSSESKLLGYDVFPEMLLEKHTHSVENESTAVVALHKAVQMKKLQKFEKAHKLFRHALFLCPSHPDVLTGYGEFLEEIEKKIIKADYFYQRALFVCPHHPKALENIKRTRPLVDKVDEEQLSQISAKLMRLNKVPPNELLKKIQKEDYFQHIHETVAIEGNTMTLAETRTFVETGVPIPGKSTSEHNEILGIVDALQFVNDTLLKRIGPITVNDIMNMHRRILGRVEPVHAGNLRKTQVFVNGHTPPPASDVCNLMKDYCKWLNSNLVEMHPVKLAAIAHQKLAFIHPFVDGNGRTSRLCMNLILMRAGYPSIIIRKQDCSLYFDCLRTAAEGDVRPFVRFIAQITEETLDVYYHAAQCGVSEVLKSLET